MSKYFINRPINSSDINFINSLEDGSTIEFQNTKGLNKDLFRNVLTFHTNTAAISSIYSRNNMCEITLQIVNCCLDVVFIIGIKHVPWKALEI